MSEKSKYEVKSVKGFEGRQGYGYNANLYRDGNKVAAVRDMADGAEVNFDWVNRDEESKLKEHIKGMTVDVFGEVMETDIDIYVGGLVDQFEEDKKFKRTCKKKTLVVLKKHSEGQYAEFKVIYSDKVKAQLEKWAADKGEEIVEIINERYIA